MNNIFKEITQIPENIKSIYIDVGLSHDAPHSFSWLGNDPDCFVFGFEPVKKNCDRVNSLIKSKGYCDRFKIYEYAVDDVSGVVNKKFYITRNSEVQDDHGQSSFFKVRETLRDKFWIDEEINVTCINLCDLIKQLNMNKLTRIKCLKLDTQGNDFTIIKSLEPSLNMIDSIQCESHTNNTYEKEEESIQSIYNMYLYLKEKGFYLTNNLLDADHFYIRNK